MGAHAAEKIANTRLAVSLSNQVEHRGSQGQRRKDDNVVRAAQVDSDDASNQLSELLAEYRSLAHKQDDGFRHWAIYEDSLAGTIQSRAVIGVPTRGCSFAMNKSKGCSVCGHACSSLWSPTVDMEDAYADFLSSFHALEPMHPPVLSIYTSGSFLDTRELPKRLRNLILSKVAEANWVRQIYFESLPQFVDEATLSEIQSIVGDRDISIGMGLDSADEQVRHMCFLRRIPTTLFRNAVLLCKRFGINTVAYIVHMPPFLSEEESVFDTANSIKNALAMHFDKVSIEPTALQTGSLQTLLARVGLYTPPTFWSVVSAIEAARELIGGELESTINLGGQVFTPLPESVLTACKHCIHTAQEKNEHLYLRLFRGLNVTEHGSHCGRLRITPPKAVETSMLPAKISQVVREARARLNSTTLAFLGLEKIGERT